MQVQLLLSAPTKRGKDITLPLFVGINLVISIEIEGEGANGDRAVRFIYNTHSETASSGSERFAQKEIILRMVYAT